MGAVLALGGTRYLVSSRGGRSDNRLASSLEVPNIQFRNPIMLPPSINKLAGGTDVLITDSDQSISARRVNLDMEKLNGDPSGQPSETRPDQTES